MRNPITLFRYWYFRRRNWYPCRKEIEELLPKKKQTDMITSMSLFYIYGDSLEEIATRFFVTRERVRQCLMKVYNSNQREWGKGRIDDV